VWNILERVVWPEKMLLGWALGSNVSIRERTSTKAIIPGDRKSGALNEHRHGEGKPKGPIEGASHSDAGTYAVVVRGEGCVTRHHSGINDAISRPHVSHLLVPGVSTRSQSHDTPNNTVGRFAILKGRSWRALRAAPKARCVQMRPVHNGRLGGWCKEGFVFRAESPKPKEGHLMLNGK